MAKHTINTRLNTFWVQKRRDLKTVTETNVSHRRSHDQWVMAKIKRPTKPKSAAFSTRAAPMVAHEMKKYGFAAVAINPAAKEECL